MERIVSLAEKETLTNARCDMMQVKSTIDNALRDDRSYHIVKRMISEDRIAIPKSFRQYLVQIFYLRKGVRIDTPLDINDWLKKHLVEINNDIDNLDPPAATCDDYDEIFRVLIGSKSVIKSKHESLLKEQMRYG
jgi:hypothetical protein